ncbi:NifB/NifX family molybdenum-iron cluster-binding protein [archaeon]|nr:NifB/NifX family molybdenum-iron cluster-binding protein [archaeon]
MKVAVSSTGNTVDSMMDPRFGRCGVFLIVDTDTMEAQPVANMSVSAAHGAGIGAAQKVASLGVKAVISGHFGPNAHMALSGAGVDIYTAQSGTVKDVVELLKKGQLNKVSSPTVGGHFGQGRGRGGGRPR